MLPGTGPNEGAELEFSERGGAYNCLLQSLETSELSVSSLPKLLSLVAATEDIVYKQGCLNLAKFLRSTVLRCIHVSLK